MNKSLKQAMQISRKTRPLPGELPKILAAEQIIARLNDKEHGELKRQLDATPDDGFVHLWNGLVLAARGEHSVACPEFFRASELGCNNWRVGWYLAQSAKAAGDLPLVDEACAAVLRANPEFWFARELPKHARGFYAQGEHDKQIEAFFAKHQPRSKVFVEVGAFDGVHYSNVRRLVEKHGWSGVSIEPVAKNFAKLEASYRGAKVRCVRACVSDREGEVELNVSTYPHLPDWGSDVASVSGEDADRWRKQYGAVWTKEKVPAWRLTTILDDAGITDVDLLSVDAEGHDLEVLQSLDFSRFKPQLIVVEYGKKRGPILTFLTEQGYTLAADNKQDLFMIQPRYSAGHVTPSSPRLLSEEEISPALAKLNPHLLKLNVLPVQAGVRQGRFDALQLVTPERFDLLAKHLYARHRALGVESEWAKELYRAHIGAFSNGTFCEGDGRKHSFDDYLRAFDATLDSLRTNGFDPAQSFVPVGRGHVIIDGAHRVAAALLHQRPVECLQFDFQPNAYGSRYFRQRGLNQQQLDAMAIEYCQLRPDTFIVLLYPAAQGRLKEARAILGGLGEIVHEKEVQLNRQGAFNLIREVYAGEKWLGTAANQFAGAWGKANPCFAQSGPLRVFVLQSASIENVRQAKQRLRDLFGVDNHSVHINDTHAQTLYLARLLLNENSIHFLNHARVAQLPNFERQMDRYRAWLAQHGHDAELFCIDGSAVMAAYGIRDSADLDVLHFGAVDFSAVEPLVNSHNSEVHHHAETRDNILFDPSNHFYSHGIKFASLDIIRRLKVKRNEGKDRRDVAAIDQLLAAQGQQPAAPRKVVSADALSIVPKAQGAATPFVFSNGWFATHQPHWDKNLTAWAAGRGRFDILEIGSYDGRSSCWFLTHLLMNPASTLTCVDAWAQRSGERVYEESMEEVFARFTRNCEATGRARQMTVHRGASRTVLPKLNAGSYDLIYVDGDHSAEGVHADTLEAFRLLRPGGLLLWNDCHGADSVKQGVDQACAELGITPARLGNNASYTKPLPKFQSTKPGAKIVALVPARNEGAKIAFCFRALARFVDAIVYLDDCSDDGETLPIVEAIATECRVERILRKPQWHRDEPGDRNALLKAGREIGGTHFVVIDADEAFTANCLEGEVLRRKTLDLNPGDRLAMTWIQLWRGVHQYRFDGSVWTNNIKPIIFCDDGHCGYSSEFIHTPRVPDNLRGRQLKIDGYQFGLLHFQFVNWRNLLLKQAWYRCIERVREPQKPVAEINVRYAPSKNETNLGLKPAPAAWLAGYPFFDASVFDVPDRWRENQVLGWFQEHGREFFRELDIWDVDWGSPSASGAQRATAKVENSESRHAAEPTSLADGFVALADREFAAGRLAAARDHLERAADTAPERADLWVALANLEFHLGDTPTALRHLNSAIQIDPENSETLVLIASLSLRQGDVEGFERALTKALKLSPEHTEGLRLLAEANFQQQRWPDAARTYFRMLKTAPNDTDALLALGVCFFKTGDTESARMTFQRVLEVSPGHELATKNLQAISGRKTNPNQPAELPLISAIVSTYKSEHFMRKCLEDLEAQTIADKLEIIIIDSGSPQNERAIVEEFQQRYSNIRYLRTERETIYAAWNRGVQMARGKYLTNANADDRHTPDAYEKLVAALEARPDCALAYADVAICENIHPDRGYTEIRGYFRWPEFDARLLFRDCYMGPQPVWRREVHQRHGLFDANFKSAGDYEFWLRMARTEKFLHVPEVLGLYWNTPQTAGHADPGLTRREADTARERYWPKEWGARPKPGFSCVEPTAFVHQTQQTVAALQARVRALESDKARLESDVQRWMTGGVALDKTSAAAPAVNLPTIAPAAALTVLQSAQQKLRERKFAEATAEATRYRQVINPDTLDRRDSRDTSAPQVSVVIVSYQAGEALLECIRSLKLSAEVPHEIILVDNGGNESVRDTLSSLPLLHVCPPANVGPAEGRNLGAHFARSPILCFLDDDAVAAPGYLASIVKAFEAHDIVALRGKVLPKTANQNNRKACHYDLGNVAVPSDLDTEGNSAVLTDAWREMGGMNSLLFGGEGLELSCRLAKRHGEESIIYWPEAVIHHDYALTDDKLERKQARHEQMRAYLLSLHPDAFDYHRRVTAHVETEAARRAAAKLVRRKTRKQAAKADSAKTAESGAASRPFISICIPTYNRAAYLPAAIQSALRQTFSDFEVVVVDDGSTDGTSAVLQQFTSDKVRCFRKEHSGGPETRNRCVAEARGEFIVWLDSDDVILPGTLERYVQAHRAEPTVDVFYGDLQLANQQLAQVGIERYRDYHGWPKALLSELFIENRIPNGFTMIRKSCFGKFGGYDRAFPRAHDYEFWTRLVGRCEVRHLDTVVGVYRLHEQSLSKPRGGADTRYEAAVSKAMLGRHSLQELLPWCFGEGTSGALGESHACRIAGLQLLKHGDVESAREWLNRAASAAAHPRTAALMRRLVELLGGKATADAAPAATEFDRTVDEAVREYRRGKARECARACARLTDLNPDAQETLLLVGLSLLRWGDPQNARAALHALLQREISETAIEIANAAERGVGAVVSESGRALQGYLAATLGIATVPGRELERVIQDVDDIASTSEGAAVSISPERLSPLFFALLGMSEQDAAKLGQADLARKCAVARKRLAGKTVPRPAGGRRPGFTFCIITNGRRPEKLRRQIESIRALRIPECEILVGGRVLQTLDNVRVVDLPDAAATGNLGLMRNTLASLAKFDHLVVSDDDMVFAPDFFEGLQRFGEGYDALAVRLTNPDGSRFWDWACVGGARGQMLLNYWVTSPEVYITGGICVIKTHVWEAVKWDDGRGFYQAEDVDFSRRLQAAGFSIWFNPFACVTHDDDRYTRVGRKVMRLDDVLKRLEAVCRVGEETEAAMLLEAAKRLVANHPAEAETLRRLCEQHREFLATCGASVSGPAMPAPDHQPHVPAEPCGTVSVSWDGSFLDLGSLSHVNRELTEALAHQSQVQVTRLGKNAVPKPLSGMKSIIECARTLRSQSPKPAQVTVRHAWPPNWEAPSTGAWVLIQPWEFGALPKEWVQNLARVDEAWVPSEYVRRVYVDSGVDAAKVHVVPNGIDPTVFHPGVQPIALATKKSFKFLFVGGTILRKGPDVLLKAYLEAFTAADDVCLVIKDFGGQSVYAGQTFEKQVKAAQSKLNAPEILYLNEELPPEALPGLYTACDALVLPYRGEGFGLPILEAMACGLPVVVTAGGAADDFATDEFAYRIPSIRRSFGNSVSGMELVKPGWMLEPDHAALVERMKWLSTHRDEAKAKSRASSEHVRREWTWERAAQKAAVRLQAVAGRVKKVSAPAVPRQVQSIELPPCAKLGHLGEARQLFKAGKLMPAWNATVSALKVRPYHPEAFLLLAEISQAAGDAKRAGALADRARKMAPKWKPARKLAKTSPAKSAQLRLELPELPTILEAPSGKQPKPRLSVFVITKNEEKFIGQCLESIRDIASQVVVVDTGSTDWTKTIAERFGAEVHAFEWCDDFSAARNAALERVSGDWILMLDADEELLPDQKDKLRALMSDSEAIAWRLPMRDKGREAEGEHFVPRLFRNAPGLFYVGRIHEQIFSSVEVRRLEWGLENKFGDALLLHHGYTKEMVQSRDKIARNLRLLRLAVEELPGEPNLLMNLGLELVRDGQLEAGLEQYSAAFAAMSALPKAQVTPELRESLLTQYASYLVSAKQSKEAVRVLESTLAKAGGLTASMHWLLGLAYIEQRRFTDGAAQMRECLAKRERKSFAPVDWNILKGGPHHCLALCLAAMKQREPADRAFHAALAAEPENRRIRFDYARFLAEGGQEVEALKWLHQLVAEDASDVQAWTFGGQIALRQAEYLEFAHDWTGEAFKAHPTHPVIAEQRAAALLLNCDADGALAAWRQAAGASTDARAAAMVLCELLVGRPVTPVAAQSVPEVSREFLQWYRRLLSLNAGQLLAVLHERLDRLRPVLPGAAQMIGDAVNEANAVPVK